MAKRAHRLRGYYEPLWSQEASNGNMDFLHGTTHQSRFFPRTRGRCSSSALRPVAQTSEGFLRGNRSCPSLLKNSKCRKQVLHSLAPSRTHGPSAPFEVFCLVWWLQCWDCETVQPLQRQPRSTINSISSSDQRNGSDLSDFCYPGQSTEFANQVKIETPSLNSCKSPS